MAGTKLTKRTVDALRPGRDRRYVFDTELPGFGVVVQPSGTKAFFVQYRPGGGGRSAHMKRITVGRYGVLTVDQARQQAKGVLADVTRGEDPASDRAAAREVPTVRERGEEYLEDAKLRRKATTYREYARLWRKHILPAFGSRQVTNVTSADVAKLHRSLADTPYLANRLLALAGSFFTFAGLNGDNPAHAVEPYKESEGRERFLTAAEVAKLGEALTRAEKVGLPPAPTHRKKPKSDATAKHRPKTADTPKKANPWAVNAIRFLLLTGWREQEALTLKWSDVDLQRGIAMLPNTKTGKSPRRIGAPARLLLSELKRIDGSAYVFPGDGARAKPGEKRPAFGTSPLTNIARVWTAVRYAAGLTDVRLHDLRHSFASVSASSGTSLLVIGKLLGHRNSRTTAKYAHLHDDPMQEAADAAASEISAWLNTPTPSVDAEASNAG